MTFGSFAKQKRERAGLTQQQCAEALGLEHRASFHKLEDGEREWSLAAVQAFAALLGKKASRLLDEYERS